jgi:hypothetical protein
MNLACHSDAHHRCIRCYLCSCWRQGFLLRCGGSAGKPRSPYRCWVENKEHHRCRFSFLVQLLGPVSPVWTQVQQLRFRASVGMLSLRGRLAAAGAIPLLVQQWILDGPPAEMQGMAAERSDRRCWCIPLLVQLLKPLALRLLWLQQDHLTTSL